MRIVSLALTAILISAVSCAAQTAGNTVVNTSKTFFGMVKTDVLRTAEKLPEDVYNYQPTPEVRTAGQLIAHIADGQYEFCSPVTGKPVSKDIEKTVKSKAALLAALKDAFAYCDAVYAGLTDAEAVKSIPFFGQNMAKIGVLDFNTAHTNEHYGNLVTYMRLKGIVPPSSEPQKK